MARKAAFASSSRPDRSQTTMPMIPDSERRVNRASDAIRPAFCCAIFCSMWLKAVASTPSSSSDGTSTRSE